MSVCKSLISLLDRREYRFSILVHRIVIYLLNFFNIVEYAIFDGATRYHLSEQVSDIVSCNGVLLIDLNFDLLVSLQLIDEQFTRGQNDFALILVEEGG